MKRSGLTFIITAITLAVFFVLTGAFAVGSVQSPRSYWLTERSGETASVTVDLDREYTVTNDDGSEKTEYKNVSAAYVYIGKVYAADENGEIGITLAFKTVNSADTSYVVDKSAKISVEGNSRYNW